MKKKFTEGKWVIDKKRDTVCIDILCNDEVVATCWDDYDCVDQLRANAKLIAAAPELLEACQWALMQFEILNDKGLYPTHLLSVNGGDGLMTIIKAINKATK